MLSFIEDDMALIFSGVGDSCFVGWLVQRVPATQPFKLFFELAGTRNGNYDQMIFVSTSQAIV